MCEFISWIEKGDKVYFLTGKQVFETKKGKEVIQKQCGVEDYIGHGAIRLYYGLEQDEGKNRECNCFTKPDNFPSPIIRAIKRGDMRGMGEPEGLLTAPAEKAYQEAKATAWKAYHEATAPAEKAYQEATAPAEKAYQEATATAFWDLFAIPENRNPAWR